MANQSVPNLESSYSSSSSSGGEIHDEPHIEGKKQEQKHNGDCDENPPELPTLSLKPLTSLLGRRTNVPKRTSQLLSRPPALARILNDVDEPKETMLTSSNRTRSDDSLIDGRYPSNTVKDDDRTQKILDGAISTVKETKNDDENLLPPTTTLRASVSMPVRIRPKRTSLMLSRPASLMRIVQDQEHEPEAPKMSEAKATDELVDGRRPNETIVPPFNENSPSGDDKRRHPSDAVLPEGLPSLSEEYSTEPAAVAPVDHQQPKSGAYSMSRPSPRNAKTRLSALPSRRRNSDIYASLSNTSQDGSTQHRHGEQPKPRKGSKSPVRHSLPGNWKLTSPSKTPKRTSLMTMSKPASLIRLMDEYNEPEALEIMVAKESDELEDGRRQSESVLPPYNPDGSNRSSQETSAPKLDAFSMISPASRNAARRSMSSGSQTSSDGSASTNSGSPNGRSPRKTGSKSSVRHSLPGNITSLLSPCARPQNSPPRRSIQGNYSSTRSPLRNSLPRAVSISSPTPRNAKARRSATTASGTGDAGAVNPAATTTTSGTTPGTVSVTSPTPRNAKARRGGTLIGANSSIQTADLGELEALTPTPGAVDMTGAIVPRNAKGRRVGTVLTNNIGQIDVGDNTSISPPASRASIGGAPQNARARRGGSAIRNASMPAICSNDPGFVLRSPRNNHRSLQLAPGSERPLVAPSSRAVVYGDDRATNLIRSGVHEEMEYVESFHEERDHVVPGAFPVSPRDRVVDELSVSAIPGSGIGAHHITNTDTFANSDRYNTLGRGGGGPPSNNDDNMVDTPVPLSLSPEAESPTKENGGLMRRKTVLLLFVILILLVGVGVAVAIALSSKKTAPPVEAKIPTDAPTLSPTTSPTQAPTSLARLMDFMDLMEPISSLDSLQNLNSPQRAALEWIAYQDRANIDPRGSRSPEEIQERYVAALLYFAMGGDQWINSISFLSETSICAWNNGLEGVGLACEDGHLVTTIKIGKFQ